MVMKCVNMQINQIRGIDLSNEQRTKAVRPTVLPQRVGLYVRPVLADIKRVGGR